MQHFQLESQQLDATGLVPHSDGWFAFWEDKLYRLMNGEDIGNLRIPLAVGDRITTAADREDQGIGVTLQEGQEG